MPEPSAQVLEELASRDGNASPAYLRLMEIAEAAGDWRNLAENARRQLAVNPLIPSPFRALARASEEIQATDEAVGAYRALGLLDDTDPAGVHYHLARLLRQSGKLKEARREALRSLEEAPRFREAHELLLDLLEKDSPKDSPPKEPAVP